MSYQQIRAEPPLFMGPTPDYLGGEPPGICISFCRTRGVYPGQMLFEMEDTLHPRGLPDRAALEAFLDAADAVARVRPTYWHCQAGLNRSGFGLAAYLHRYGGMRISDAIRTLRTLRSPYVLENRSFEGALRRWYGQADEQTFSPYLEEFSLFGDE